MRFLGWNFGPSFPKLPCSVLAHFNTAPLQHWLVGGPAKVRISVEDVGFSGLWAKPHLGLVA